MLIDARKIAFSMYFKAKMLLLNTLRCIRATGYRVFWLMRGNLFHVYFFAKYLLLKSFWTTRAAGYRVFWFTRSLPFRLRFFLRRLFYKYLFQYRPFKIIRHAINAIGSRYFKAKVQLLHGLKGQWHAMELMREFCVRHHTDALILAPAGQQAIAGPRFLGKYSFTPIGEPIVHLNMPEVALHHLQNAAVIGGTNFARVDNKIIYPDVFLPERDVCPAELNGIAKIDLTAKKVSIFAQQGDALKSGVSLLGSCTGNYAHWLIETLPKLPAVDSVQTWNDYPLLVDAWIHPNFVRSIELFNKNRRAIVRVKRWQTVCVDSLIEVTPPAYIPPEYRDFLKTKKISKPSSADFSFSIAALDALRTAAHAAVGGVDRCAPQKLYLSRSPESCGNTRYVTNIDAIEQIVKRYGYTMLDPAKLSFDDQIRAFSNAKKIIAPLGAALANTIFTPPGCKVLGLSAWYHNANYYFFSNLMGALGHTMFYALGQQTDQWGHVAHKNYAVDLRAFNIAIEHLETHE